jgi:hypothetical protein
MSLLRLLSGPFGGSAAGSSDKVNFGWIYVKKRVIECWTL